jgi:uncharacterized MAPEG superfamily protein
MHSEYQILAIATLLFMFAWLPVSIGKSRSFGLKWLASNRAPAKDKELEGWASRCERAYANLKDYFPAFIVAILLLGQLNKFDETTKWAAILFVVARVTHYTAYGFGNFSMRFLSYILAMAANLYLLLKVFF